MPSSVHPPTVSLLIAGEGSGKGAPSIEFPDDIQCERIAVTRGSGGRGVALMNALDRATGSIVLFYTRDLAPANWEDAIVPIAAGTADAVYGPGNLAGQLPYAIRTSLIDSIPLRSAGTLLEAEIAVKLRQRAARVVRIGSSAPPPASSAFARVAARLRFGFVRDIYRDSGAAILDTLASTQKFNRWMADTIRQYKGKAVLEIGCGIGNLTKHLLVGTRTYTAVDIDREKLIRLRTELAKQANLHVQYCDLTNPSDISPYRGQMDTVICLNVLEHIQDDAAGLRHIHSALQPGGRAIILVPEGMSVYGSLDEVLGHCRRYSAAELRQKATEAGFKIENILEFNRITRPAWFFNGRILKRTTFSRLQLWIFDQFVWLWKRLDAVLPWKPTSLILIARKLDS
ncbi:MAG TPA: class I SAM-dependent methyltransferase [Bryobacteraceae bacterium]|nr:class I SAM-dependent methyltransferase [Bryobacteraceae bacterium]